MAIHQLLSIIVFLLFIQKGIYGLVTNITHAHAKRLFFFSMFFACWSLSDAVLHSSATLGVFGPFNVVGLLGWSFLPLFMNWSCSLLVNHPAEPAKRRGEMLVLFLTGVPLALAASGQWIPGLARIPLFHASGPWPYFLGFVLLSGAYYILRKLLVCKNLRGDQHISFRLVFFPLVLFLLISLASEFILPLVFGPAVRIPTPWSGIIWFGFLLHAMKKHDAAPINPGRSGPMVVGNLHLPVFLCNIDLSLFQMNPCASDLFYPDKSPEQGDSLPAAFRDPDRVEAGLLEAASTGQSGPEEVSISMGNGTSIPLMANFYLVKDGFNDVHGLAMVCTDLRLEKQLGQEIISAKEESRKLAKQQLLLGSKLGEYNTGLAKAFRELQMKFSESQRMEEKIEKDISERDVLINEIHNRVIYNMNLITSLILSQATDHIPQPIKQKFFDMARRVRSILLVHQHLYLSVNYSEVDFKGFLQTLTEELLGFYGLLGKVEVRMNLADDFIDIQKAIPLGLIANELISNVLVHAWAGTPAADAPGTKKLKVDFSRLKSGWQLTIADNGKGLPGGIKTGSGQTLGLPLVEILAGDQLGAKVRVRSANGTSIRLEF
jgi:two-component sensor histidine kinase